MENKTNIGFAGLILGAVILLLFTAFALFPSVVAPYSPTEMFRPWQSPSAVHLLGTNDMGYDIFSELVHATSFTLGVGVAAAVLSVSVGVVMGLLAGFGGRAVRWCSDLVINTFVMIPLLPAAIVTAAIVGTGRLTLVLTIGLLGWCGTARAVRAGANELRHADFVESLTILGIPRRRILWLHLLPNLSGLIGSRLVMSVASCIMTEATLGFLGLADPTHVTWGGMVSLAYSRGGLTRGALNWFAAPGLCITATVLAFFLINRYLELRADRVSAERTDS